MGIFVSFHSCDKDALAAIELIDSNQIDGQVHAGLNERITAVIHIIRNLV